MTGPSWLVDSKRIASKIKNASEQSDPTKHKWISNPTKACPQCNHIIDNSDVVHEWPGLPKGVKFDPSDRELLWHLLAKVGKSSVKPHPFINEFIPTVEKDEGICYTHPKRLPGVKQDGSVSHFFHRTFKAYNTGTRKRRKISNDDSGDVRWHKTGKTKPVLIEGKQVGCKKIMVLYVGPVRGGKPEKTNWVMHQYHLGTDEDERDGEYVVSKLFYQQVMKPGEKSGPTDLTVLDAVECTGMETGMELEGADEFRLEADEFGLECDEELASKEDSVQVHEHATDQVDENQAESEKPEETNWLEIDSQNLLDSQQLAENISILNDFLLSQSQGQSQTACDENEKIEKSGPCLSDYAHLPVEELRKDLEECKKIGVNANANANANVELDTITDFRLSQLDCYKEMGSQDSLLA